MRSRDFDLDFRERSTRIRDWGAGLLLLSALLWGWCAILLLTDYEVEKPNGNTDECAARLFTEGGTANEGLWRGDYCEDERDWPEALAVLGLSLPVSLVGTALFTTGSVSRRMSGHAQAMRELDRIADEREKREKHAGA
ncbi:hypothetical protein PZ61_0225785 [Streptomyces sp. MNU77]|uniref:hypothetical protein n=1 Tax=Streptomyces sp. MNU77 TaxID=1573406 RepID=UPI0005E90CA9|nr:hypothetical protein [Streptomyces sp. MNU77]OLO33563.1 hypothetical protein PZ61_0225785 [Streptomyces sp. MNU77]